MIVIIYVKGPASASRERYKSEDALLRKIRNKCEDVTRSCVCVCVCEKDSFEDVPKRASGGPVATPRVGAKNDVRRRSHQSSH